MEQLKRAIEDQERKKVAATKLKARAKLAMEDVGAKIAATKEKRRTIQDQARAKVAATELKARETFEMQAEEAKIAAMEEMRGAIEDHARAQVAAQELKAREKFAMEEVAKVKTELDKVLAKLAVDDEKARLAAAKIQADKEKARIELATAEEKAAKVALDRLATLRIRALTADEAPNAVAAEFEQVRPQVLRILRGSGAPWFMTAVMRVDPTDEAIAIATIFILWEIPDSVQEDLLKLKTHLRVEVFEGKPVFQAGRGKGVPTDAYHPHYEPEMFMGCSLGVAGNIETGTFGGYVTSKTVAARRALYSGAACEPSAGL
jgi:hypothetical protein